MKTKKTYILSLLAIILVLCAACLPISTTTTSGGPSGGSASSADRLLASAETAYNQGQYRAAADYYKRYLASVPNPSRLESILAVYGLSAEKAGQFSDAAAAYERLVYEFPGSEFSAEARPRLATIYLASGDAVRAENLAVSLLAGETDAARQARLRLIMAQSQWVQGRFPDAASNYLTVWRASSGETKNAAQAGVLASLTKMNTATLEQVNKQYGQNFPGPEATYVLVQRAAESGDSGRTLALADYFRQYFSANPLMPQVAALAQSVTTPGAAVPALAFGADYDPRRSLASAMAEQAAPATMGNLGSISGNYTLAVILPMSGEGAKYAQEIVAGLKLAIQNFSAAGTVGLEVMDTRGSADEAGRLVNQAASNSRILAVVGPFLSREAAQAAQTANRAGLPLIAITQRADVTTAGPNIFRIFLTPRHQAEAVARYAVGIQGHQALGILYPDDNYGNPMKTYFENEVRRLGAGLTVSEGYEPKAADWAELVTRLTGAKAARKVSSNYQAQTAFAALYLPDSAGAVSQILAQLAYHDVTKMQYLGSPLWYNQEFLTSSSRYIQGAVIPVALSDLSQREETRRFIESFQSAYGHAPDQFAAYGYDAGLAVIKALGQGATSRESLRRALNQGAPVPGATGPFTFDQNGEYSVEPTLLSVKDRSFILLKDAGPGLR